MSSALSAFHWRGQPSIFAAASKQGQGATPQKDHPLRKPPAVYKKNGLVTPDNNGFSIPSRLQAQADTDRRRSIVKGGI